MTIDENIIKVMIANRANGLCDKANSIQIKHDFGFKISASQINKQITDRFLAKQKPQARIILRPVPAKKYTQRALPIKRVSRKGTNCPKPQNIVTQASIIHTRIFIQNCIRAELTWRDTLDKVVELYPYLKKSRSMRLIVEGRKTAYPATGRVCGLIRGVPFYEDEQCAERWI